jgi:DNA polymerase II small subunit/DNA polymerase delta subunit B
MVNILGQLTLAIVKLTAIRQAGLLHKWLLLKRHKSAWTTFQILPMIKKVVIRQDVTHSQTCEGHVAQLHQQLISRVCLMLSHV